VTSGALLCRVKGKMVDEVLTIKNSDIAKCALPCMNQTLVGCEARLVTCFTVFQYVMHCGAKFYVSPILFTDQCRARPATRRHAMPPEAVKLHV